MERVANKGIPRWKQWAQEVYQMRALQKPPNTELRPSLSHFQESPVLFIGDLLGLVHVLMLVGSGPRKAPLAPSFFLDLLHSRFEGVELQREQNCRNYSRKYRNTKGVIFTHAARRCSRFGSSKGTAKNDSIMPTIHFVSSNILTAIQTTCKFLLFSSVQV